MVLSVHGLWFGIGAISSALVYFWLQKKAEPGFKMYHAFEDLAVLMFSGLIGARIAYVVFYNVGGPLWNYLTFWEIGLISYGGILTGSITLLLLARLRRYPRVTLDNIATAALFGWALGRIGNFLAKDAYGIFDPSFGEVFYNRVPIQLYELIGLLVLFGAALLLRKGQKKAGWGFWYALAGYGILRFMVDFWRDLPPVLGSLNISQVFAFTIFICGMIGLLIWRKRKLV